jgi:hypothetical protein
MSDWGGEILRQYGHWIFGMLQMPSEFQKTA